MTDRTLRAGTLPAPDGTFRAVRVAHADDETIACGAVRWARGWAGVGTDRASTLRDE